MGALVQDANMFIPYAGKLLDLVIYYSLTFYPIVHNQLKLRES